MNCGDEGINSVVVTIQLFAKTGVILTKTWFITGASKGFGREWAEAALERGDEVAATARRLETLDALVDAYGDAVLPIQLDVTDKDADFDAVERAAEHFGKLDVVINNAGYGHFGMIEELTEDEVRSQLETNFFGALWVTQAALPIMRAQGSGHIIQVSSIGGISAFPTVGAYHASKWALEGFSQSLAQEVAGFGIHVTLIEPGGYSTDWSGSSATHSEENPAYADVREAARNRPSAANPGDPKATRDAILKVVDADEPPLRIFFGEAPLEIATKDYESRLATWNEWQPVSIAAHGA
jgi:NAD(P)-dependent dehydrogenase (short-subunit alcohol dehydrogenase family)